MKQRRQLKLHLQITKSAFADWPQSTKVDFVIAAISIAGLEDKFMWRMIGVIGLFGLLAGCTSGTTGDEEPFLWLITVQGTGNQVITTKEGETAVLDIHSETGIGGAQVQLQSGTWPQTIMLRFHLSGLEEMTLTVGETTITLNISSQGDNEIRQSVTLNGNTEAIGPNSPYWMNVTLTAEDGSAGTVPLDKGTIQVTIPKDITQSGQTSFTIQWIDFYR